MYCPQCGSLIIPEDSRFCTKCGCSLENVRQPYIQSTPAPDHQSAYNSKPRVSGTKVLAVAVAAILILTAVGGYYGFKIITDDGIYSETTGEIYDYEYYATNALSDGTIVLSEGVHEFEDVEKNSILFTLNDDVSSKYGYYEWHLSDPDDTAYTIKSELGGYKFTENNGTTIEKEEPVLYWGSYGPSSSVVSVMCYENEGDTGGTFYSGYLMIDGTLERDYAWTYDSVNYGLSIDFEYSEYKAYRDSDVNYRGTWNHDNMTDFATDNTGTVSSICEQLTDLYLSEYGSNADTEGQDFADFILAFVQCCYEYPPFNDYINADQYIYGKGNSEYYAYPMETIFYGAGDCEDTSLLAATIYCELGYSTGICLLPSHATVAVALSSYVEPYYDRLNYEILKDTVYHKTYYIGETTFDRAIALGIMTKMSNTEWYSDHLDDDGCGIYLVTSWERTGSSLPVYG